MFCIFKRGYKKNNIDFTDPTAARNTQGIYYRKNKDTPEKYFIKVEYMAELLYWITLAGGCI